MSPPAFLDKAQEALKAAQLLLEQGCTNSAANRTYYAVFHAARAALIAARMSTTQQKWSHEAIQGQFQRLTRQKKIYPAHMNQDLSRLSAIRELADYDADLVNFKTARDVVKTASVFVAKVIKETQPWRSGRRRRASTRSAMSS